jgi:hypothetical protein
MSHFPKSGNGSRKFKFVFILQISICAIWKITRQFDYFHKKQESNFRLPPIQEEGRIARGLLKRRNPALAEDVLQLDEEVDVCAERDQKQDDADDGERRNTAAHRA